MKSCDRATRGITPTTIVERRKRSTIEFDHYQISLALLLRFIGCCAYVEPRYTQDDRRYLGKLPSRSFLELGETESNMKYGNGYVSNITPRE